ncbi:MAG: hypothetical protein KGR69_13530 [Verrucomicrobia bacterium]|nr:hypothetical protein [Verrucomicrobiota bacterium]
MTAAPDPDLIGSFIRHHPTAIPLRSLLLPAAFLAPILLGSCVNYEKYEQRREKRNASYYEKQERRQMREYERDDRYDAWVDRLMD